MRPSQVVIAPGAPLAGTMGKCEAEVAAAVIVLTCEVNGDRWQAVTQAQMVAALKAAVDENRGPWRSLTRNPFLRPNVPELVRRGFARWTGEAGAVEFTMWGLVALQPWVRS